MDGPAPRALLVATLLAAAALLATAAPASASHYARFGIQDDAWLMYGSGKPSDTLAKRLNLLQRLGVGIVRVTLRWDQIAPTKPAVQRNPNDPAYHWGRFDTLLDALHRRHITPLVTIWGSPRWANEGLSPNHLPLSGFGNFAYAAAQRYPWVRLWTIWNEPNLIRSAIPVSPRLYVRRLLNPAYVLLHKANRRNKVAGGVTSPRKAPRGMSPTTFMELMRRYHARLDAYAQNPYPSSSIETPFHSPCAHCKTLTMARLGVIRAQVTNLFGHKPVWLTEYGYQTNPPDRFYGVPPLVQAKYVGEAALRVWQMPGVTIMIHFLMRDEPAIGGWQSGFFTVHGVAKPALRAFGLPLAQLSRKGKRTRVWGQVRPGSGRRPYVLQRWNGRRWVAVGSLRRTSVTGTFERTIRAGAGAKLRIWTPLVGYSSPLLRVT